jgi:hypothetical protein
LENAITPVHCVAAVAGKNAVDIALTIDAMDLVHAGGLDGMCLVTSDSDFTRLAHRLREGGLLVYGFGKAATPPSFIAACERFTPLDLGSESSPDRLAATTTAAAVPRRPSSPGTPHIVERLAAAIERASGADGWALLSQVGQVLRQADPEFDPRAHEYKTLTHMLREYPEHFELSSPKGGQGGRDLVRRVEPALPSPPLQGLFDQRDLVPDLEAQIGGEALEIADGIRDDGVGQALGVEGGEF